ncbi:uncharacterized protein V1510DRAFT_418474 [Dipodascopsis tothii]|uniref:uncharacterized protein n=1 Tax=Dipodascopsis tothii TaxID=44089 RepID=UPI0034CFE691
MNCVRVICVCVLALLALARQASAVNVTEVLLGIEQDLEQDFGPVILEIAQLVDQAVGLVNDNSDAAELEQKVEVGLLQIAGLLESAAESMFATTTTVTTTATALATTTDVATVFEPTQTGPGATGTATAAPKETDCMYSTGELFDLYQRFMDNLMFPANVIQANSINSTLLAENVVGRVDDTRRFDGRELNTEYLFGLFAYMNETNGIINLLGTPTNYTVVEFLAGCNTAATSTLLNLEIIDLALNVTMQLDFWFRWDSEGRVSEYDAAFRRGGRIYDIVSDVVSARLSGSNVATPEGTLAWKKLIAGSICGQATLYCTGDNLQYESMEACEAYLVDNVRMGEVYEGGMNTLWCRSVHQNMLKMRPDVHCAHVGPSGGDMCRDSDMDYETVVWGYKDAFSSFIYY